VCKAFTDFLNKIQILEWRGGDPRLLGRVKVLAGISFVSPRRRDGYPAQRLPIFAER